MMGYLGGSLSSPYSSHKTEYVEWTRSIIRAAHILKSKVHLTLSLVKQVGLGNRRQALSASKFNLLHNSSGTSVALLFLDI